MEWRDQLERVARRERRTRLLAEVVRVLGWILVVGSVVTTGAIVLWWLVTLPDG